MLLEVNNLNYKLELEYLPDEYSENFTVLVSNLKLIDDDGNQVDAEN
jgi:uncharacterized protein YnzC (UPF0291/DUF896 family)